MKYKKQSYYEEKKSKFYGYLYYINTEEEIKEIINQTKKEHKKAKHIVYAYKINEKEKINKDKEPTGTVSPLLDIIKKQNKNKILIVVVRYFGGTLLGAGPLTRAYSKTTALLFK